MSCELFQTTPSGKDEETKLAAASQIRGNKNGGALTLGVGMDTVGSHFELSSLNEIQDVMTLPHAARREAPE